MLLAAAGTLGIAAPASNRPGNFSIRPKLKPGARLVSSGIYRRIRHPMYGAVLLGGRAAVLADPRPWRAAAWLAPLAVLIAKLRREERHLLQRFGDYAVCRRWTQSPVPPIF